MNKEKEEFLHVILGSDVDFGYGYENVKEILYHLMNSKVKMTGLN